MNTEQRNKTIFTYKNLKGWCIVELKNSSELTTFSIPCNLVLDKNSEQFMPLLALLKVLEKT